MKMRELIQEQTTFEIGKSLNMQMREIAAELDLTWGDMPGFMKKGVWYGGRVAPKGGQREEKKRDMTLPFDRRAKAFFRILGKFLAQKHEEGHVIAISPNQMANTKAYALKPEEFQDSFDKVALHHDDYAVCRWYISFSEQQKQKSTFMRLGATIVYNNETHLGADLAFLVEPWQLKRATSQIKSLNDTLKSKLAHDLFVIWKNAGGAVKNHARYTDQLGWEECLHVALNPSRPEPMTGTRVYYSDADDEESGWGEVRIKGAVMSQETIKVPGDEVLQAIDKWYLKR